MKYELDESFDNNRQLPSVPAIYLICSNNKIIYIGKSISINARLTPSRLFRDFWRHGITHFYVFPYYDDLLELEEKLIKMFEPSLNKHHSSKVKSKNKKYSSRHTDKFYEKIELELKNFYSVTPSDKNHLCFTHS